MTIALEDLGRGRRRLQPEALARHALHLRLDCGVLADRARELADAHAVQRPLDPGAVAVEREGPPGELQAERGRLGMHAVCAPDRERVPMLLGPRDHGGEGTVESLEHERAGFADLQRERGVDDVRRGEPVVEPSSVGAERPGHGVDEGRDVVVRHRLELRNACRRRRRRPDADRGDRFCGHRPEVRPPVERGQLDLEPARELRLLRPDPRHRRTGVASDHRPILGAAPALALGHAGHVPNGQPTRATDLHPTRSAYRRNTHLSVTRCVEPRSNLCRLARRRGLSVRFDQPTGAPALAASAMSLRHHAPGKEICSTAA